MFQLPACAAIAIGCRWWMGDGPTIVWANLVWCLVIIGWTGFWMVSPSPAKLPKHYLSCQCASEIFWAFIRLLANSGAGKWTALHVGTEDAVL